MSSLRSSFKDLTVATSTWLDGVKLFGYKAIADSKHFFFTNDYTGFVWASYSRNKDNAEYMGIHTVFYRVPSTGKTVSKTTKTIIRIRNSGNIIDTGMIWYAAHPQVYIKQQKLLASP